MKRSLQQADMEAFLLGATLYGTGGGGEAEWGRVIMENDYAKGRTYELVDPEDVPDDAFVCSGGIMGSVKSLDDISYPDIVEEWESFFPLVESVKIMEKLHGRKVDYLIPFEIGGLNSPVIFAAAARLGIPCVNGDLVGRAAPETQMTSLIGNGVDLYPMPLVDRYGNTFVVVKSEVPTYADEVGRFIVVKGGGMGANAHYPTSGKRLKETCVPYMMTKAIEAGNMILNAETGREAIAQFQKSENGIILFEGAVTQIEGVDKGGFYLTNMELGGEGEFAGKAAKLVIKNETMALWVNGEVKCIFPDLVFMMDPENGSGIPTIEVEKGRRMVLVGAACQPTVQSALQSDTGKVAFGPARYGYNELAYRPFAELNKA